MGYNINMLYLKMKQIIKIKDIDVSLYSKNEGDYISLTDIAKYKGDRSDMIIQN